MKKILIALLILILAAVACYYAFPERVAGYMVGLARSKAGLIQKEIKIDDHNIVYLEGGKGETILLLHGYTGDKDNWTLFAAYLTKDYHVVIPDIPGYGQSSQFMDKPYDLNNQISRLHKFAQATNLKNFILPVIPWEAFSPERIPCAIPMKLAAWGCLTRQVLNHCRKVK